VAAKGERMTDRCSTLVLGWVDYHTRNEGIASELGGETVYPLWGPRGSAPMAVLRYVVQGLKTAAVLIRRRPRRLIVMVPPIPALAICTLYARLTGAQILGDVHTYPLVADVWRPFLPATAWLLKRGSGAVVTNEANAAILRRYDVPTLVMHDTPVLTPGRDKPVVEPDSGRPHVVMPASFDPDEPIAEVFTAASTMPDVDFTITGRDNRGVTDGLAVPDNVTLSGYVSREDYEDLLRNATVVCSLTVLENCMQQAGYEAMAFGRPLVTSDSEVLREYFGGAARLTGAEAEQIAEALRDAIDRAPELHAAMVALGEERVAARAVDVVALERMLAGGAPPEHES
jgi:glycosyltransferase involved in cell wall biosynthesis